MRTNPFCCQLPHFVKGDGCPQRFNLPPKNNPITVKAQVEETITTLNRQLREIVQRLNRRLNGWAQYFRGGQGNIYGALDGWIRMRLRCILRRRAGRKGRGRPDHRKYTNSYFAELGLISLKASAWAKRANPA